MPVQFLVGLLAGHGHFAGVLDDDIVAAVVWARFSLNLASDSGALRMLGEVKREGGRRTQLAWS